jgi:gamma-glutamyltranspeptidase
MGVATVISNIVDFGMDPALAVDAARVEAERCCTIELEEARVPADEQRELVRRGHTIERRGEYHPLFVPLVQVAGIGRDGRRFGASDPRYDRGDVAVTSP